MRRAALTLVLSWLLFGCTVAAVDTGGDNRPNNACSSDDACAEHHCRFGVCQTLKGQLEALLIAATPPTDSDVPHLTFASDVTGVPTSGGEKDLLLEGPAQVQGTFTLPAGMTCYPTFDSDDPKHPFLNAIDKTSLPVTATFLRRERLLGLPQQVYIASTTTLNFVGGYTFDIQIPAGDYDVYLVPPRKQEEGCRVPPQVYRGAALDKPNGAYSFPMSPISTLKLKIHRNKGEPSIDGWLADIIEPVAGNPISTEVALAKPSDLGEASPVLDYSVELAFSTVQPPPDPTVEQPSDLVRLRPPAGVVAPTVYVARDGLGLFAADPMHVSADVDSLTRYPAPVDVEGQLRRADDNSPVAGVVTLVSESISGMDSGVFGSFQTTATVDATGVFKVLLPPGSYLVQAVPPAYVGTAGDQLAPVVTPWLIPADISPQAGKLLELSPIKRLTGQARVEGAQVQANATPQPNPPFKQVFGKEQFEPRAVSGLVDANGRFAVPTDPGKLDVSVQAPDSLGFAWFVRPGVEVSEQKDADLGRVTLPIPSLLTGRALLTGDVVLPSASIRAYAYLDANLQYTRDPKQAASVIQVAETRAKEDGSFRLLIPSSITAPK